MSTEERLNKVATLMVRGVEHFKSLKKRILRGETKIQKTLLSAGEKNTAVIEGRL